MTNGATATINSYGDNSEWYIGNKVKLVGSCVIDINTVSIYLNFFSHLVATFVILISFGKIISLQVVKKF